MGFINKVINFRQTIGYHRLLVKYNYLKIITHLFFLKNFKNRSIFIIILPEHIGDVIAFTPFAEKLKLENKNAYIVWLIKPSYKSIIEFNKSIDQCLAISCDGIAEIFSKNKSFKTFDVRFNGNNYCPICDTKRIYNKIDENFTLANYYEYGSLLEIFSTIAGQPMSKLDWKPKIFIPSFVENKVKKFSLPEKYIVIHTASNDPAREWVNEKWENLMQQIKTTYQISIVQIGLENKLNNSNQSFIDLCGKLSLIETAEVIKKATLFIGIDSGPAHIANAVEAKSLILLGKYRKIEHYMPFSGNFAIGINSKIIYNSKINCSEIEVSEVLKEIQLLLKTNE